MRSGSYKAVGMCDDPVGHETAIGTAGLTDSSFIDSRILLQYRIDEIHQVLKVRITVLASDIRKFITTSIRSFYVGKHDEVSL